MKEYKRLTPLKISTESLKGSLKNIKKGDCIVTFSRRDIFDLKREIELNTPHKCALVYGSLPPEIRAEQARYYSFNLCRLFNDPESNYDVMVASDAIGMGMNLYVSSQSQL